MTETILMHQFVQSKLQQLNSGLAQVNLVLEKIPKDVHHESMKKKLQNDIEIILPIFRRLETELLQSIEKESGKEFQVLLQREKEPFKEQIKKLTREPVNPPKSDRAFG